MIERIKKSIFGYTYITDPDYNAAIIGWMNRRFSWNIQKYTIIPCNGVVNAHFVTLMTNPGEGVIIRHLFIHNFLIPSKWKVVKLSAIIYCTMMDITLLILMT